MKIAVHYRRASHLPVRRPLVPITLQLLNVKSLSLTLKHTNLKLKSSIECCSIAKFSLNSTQSQLNLTMRLALIPVDPPTHPANQPGQYFLRRPQGCFKTTNGYFKYILLLPSSASTQPNLNSISTQTKAEVSFISI